MKTKLLGLLAVIALIGLLPSRGHALTFDFSFTGGCNVAGSPCTVTGEIDGLKNNATSAATAVIIDTVSSPAFTVLSLPFNTICGSSACSVTPNTFTVTAGAITAESFFASSTGFTSTPPFLGEWSLSLGGLETGIMSFSNGTTILGNSQVFQDNVVASGASFTQVQVGGVPESSTWAMMLLGFAGLGFIAYRRKSKPALSAA
jgi:hypothetical protein